MVYIEKKEREMPTQPDDTLSSSAATKQPHRRAVRLVDLALGFANAAVLGLSIAFSSGALQPSPAPTQDAGLTSEASGDGLWETLGSDKFASFQREYAQEQIEKDLADAERLKAEAEGLKVQAVVDASETKQAAEESAEATRLEASYDGVAQRYHRPEGFEITLNYPTAVKKEQTEFGYTATARPTTTHGTVRVFVNLATVNEGNVLAGNSIGTVGEYPVGEGIKAF